MIEVATLLIISIIVFLFLFWRRLKEDYPEDQIFTTGFYTILLSGLFGYAALYYESPWWFWTGFLGAVIGLIAGILRFKLRVLETVEAASIALLPVVSFIFLRDLLANLELKLALGAIFPIILLGLFFLLDKKYKGFIWYRSGKVGFAGLTVLGVFFLTRSAVAIAFGDMISFVGSADAFISGILSFASFLTIYNLAQK